MLDIIQLICLACCQSPGGGGGQRCAILRRMPAGRVLSLTMGNCRNWQPTNVLRNDQSTNVVRFREFRHIDGCTLLSKNRMNAMEGGHASLEPF